MRRFLACFILSIPAILPGAEEPKRSEFEKSTDDKRPEMVSLYVELTTLQSERTNKETWRLEGEPSEREIELQNIIIASLLGDPKK